MKLRRRKQTQEVKVPKQAKPLRQEVKQNRAAGGTAKDKLIICRDLHIQAWFYSLLRLGKTPFASAITIAVLAISIALAGSFQLLLINFQQIAGNFQTSAQISLFLRENINENRARILADTLRKNPAIESVQVISKEQGRALFKTFGSFGAAIDMLDENPLPVVIEIMPKNTLDDDGQIETLVNTLKQRQEVDFVRMDMEWLQRLQAIMAVARRLFVALNTLLGFAVLFITGNTIRLELNNRQEEIMITKLVGATNSFIATPFIYSGFWIGFFAGVLAWFIVALLMVSLRAPVEALSSHYNGNFHLLFLSVADSIKLILVSASLSMLGSCLVVFNQLNKTNPQ